MLTRGPILPPSVLGFTGSDLDRAHPIRLDPAGAAAAAADPAARAYVIAGEHVFGRREGDGLDPLFGLAEAERLGEIRERVWLGKRGGAGRFGFGLAPDMVEELKQRPGLVAVDLRTIAIKGLVAAEHLSPLAAAKALLLWHARHRFCSVCGTRTAVVEVGWRRDCPSCGAQHFPRTDPVVIMLTVDGERCVLGRQAKFAPGMWSCLAGFVEPGESIEEAVRRETAEEVGVTTGAVAYAGSQPWPFPMSLMIGAYARALTFDLEVDHGELEDARWFEREEVAAMLGNRHPAGLTVPPRIGIAHAIIRAFVEDPARVTPA